ncbi:MAG TPA: endonuclease/exonuclease/phosphatase family protein [Candidatus Solibacter sp.]|nr:endonuclease/exonuclease/phosphatase family protein [Candidatus Solibacter sp.]
MSPMLEIETGNFAISRWVVCPPNSLKIVNWNINRGLQLQKVIQFLAGAKPDIVLLQECDLNARRTHHLNIAREIAQQLQLNYVFGREFQELTQGSRRSPAYHGQSTLSRWPLSNSRILRFRKQSNFWRPHWFIPEIDPFQERIGGRLALVSEVDLGGKIIVTYNLHLESRGDDGLRESQIEEALHDAGQYSTNTPVLIAGDFNMNVSTGISAVAIREARFQDAFVNQHPATTPGSFFEDGRVIDWIFLRGPIRSRQPQVYRSISGSDHYPLSVTLILD